MKILLVGGGTGGATTPLLALAEEYRRRDPYVRFLFVGTSRGPERSLVQSTNITFFSIPAGKLRRYFSLLNISDLIITMFGFFKAYSLIRREKPDVLIGVGGYVQVPVMYAGYVLGIPSMIHQQDVVPGLANSLCAPISKKITVAFEESLRYFPKRKTSWIGNPTRGQLLQGSKKNGYERFNLHRQLPVLLAFGGGTGSQQLNQLIAEASLTLVNHFQIIHITGGRDDSFTVQHPHYHPYTFLTDGMADAYAVSDLVICRAGLSTLSELSTLGKAAVLVPLPHSHQVINARFFEEKNAVIVAQESTLDHFTLERLLIDLYENSDRRKSLEHAIHRLSQPNATGLMVHEIMSLIIPRKIISIEKKLRLLVKDVRSNEMLARHTNFRLGGPADLFAVCTSAGELVQALKLVRVTGVPCLLLGGGANLVVADHGFSGVVIQVRNLEFERVGDDVIAGAGMNTGTFVHHCHEAGLIGAEFLVGIYGTIGGAVRGNAGSFGKEMKDIIVSCEIMTDTGIIKTWNKDRFNFGYRDSAVKHEPVTILTVRVSLQTGDITDAKKTVLEYAKYKKEHQPLGKPSAGCMFKNYVLRVQDHALAQRFADVMRNGAVPAWALIQGVGMAGMKMGGIEISEQHANFFLNNGKGTAKQVVMLVSMVKQRVRDAYGVQLVEEVQFIGY